MSEYGELTEDYDDAELTEPGEARKLEAEVPEPSAEGQRRDTDARRIGLGARSLDVPGSVSSEGSGAAGETAPSPTASAGCGDRVTAPELSQAKPDWKPGKTGKGAKRMPRVIKSPAEVPAALKRVTNLDHEWLLRRSKGKA